MVILWVFGFLVFAGFVPPPAPSMNAQQVAGMFRDHANPIRFGLLLTLIASPLLMPFTAVISVHLKRIEGRHSPLTYTQIGLGGVVVLAFIFPVMILEAAAFRPERAPEIIEALNDIGWILFIGVVTNFVLQLIVIGVAVLQDKHEQPIFPRWAGYFNIWGGLVFFPGALCVFFKTGPFAWNGVFAWWIPVVAFAVWLAVMTVLLLKAIDRQAGELGTAPELNWDFENIDLYKMIGDLTAKVHALETGGIGRARAPEPATTPDSPVA